jgi:signal peptidase II
MGEKAIPSRVTRLLVVILVLLCTAGCDQATKHIARSELGPAGSARMAGGLLQFILAENPGAFLSLGASLPQSARGVFLTAGVGIGLTLLLAYIIGRSRFSWLPFLGLLLVWAGGMSNLFDRFARHGLVTDFMILRVGPLHTGIFNVADVIILLGIGMFAVSMRAGYGPASRKSRRDTVETRKP